MRKHWFVSITLFLIVGFISLHFYQIQRIEEDLRDVREIPMKIGEWTSKDLTVTDREYEILETENLIVREYQHPNGSVINLFVIYSETNRRVCHPPVVCLIGSGAEVTQTSKGSLALSNQTIPVNHIVVESGGNERLVLYWYMLGDEFTDDYFTQQLRWVFKQSTGHLKRGVGGALIRMITPMVGTEEETLANVQGFVEELVLLLTQNLSQVTQS